MRSPFLLIAEAWNSPDGVQRQLIAVEIVQHDHIERCCSRAFLLVAAHMNIVVIVPPVGQLVMEGKRCRDPFARICARYSRPRRQRGGFDGVAASIRASPWSGGSRFRRVVDYRQAGDLRSRNYVNLIIAGKRPEWQWLALIRRVRYCTAGAGIWRWASNDAGDPDVVMACAGDAPNLETLGVSRRPEFRFFACPYFKNDGVGRRRLISAGVASFGN